MLFYFLIAQYNYLSDLTEAVARPPLSLFEFQACNQLSCSGIYYRKYNYVSPLLLVWTS